ncbi:peptidyl prolyl cis-trans isomerase cyclophilin [Aureobasidium sp. EXF-10727]|nr:peptidyl prolyl cis-trans isomerase cyclophilin [Aureobasidium sp. EXF-10727]KAI4735745.1 peptidyl prolyl cis-trans isomerase cyclophilin [Aureobasidium sp. EXF-12298]KAI4759291.1 peptidyl prolyl cis-trans isomerase cyclophilin [Aureobasidium sp. EXF-12344]KAI4777839.1 peptidyl prolyl cis-trans isomerase cyclophilin [Aureobasidium sp. EXF-3400]
MSDAPRPKATVYVGGLTSAVDSHTLHNAFIPFGPIVNISLPKPELPSNPEPHRGFGYVEFESPQDAQESIDNMDQSELFGRVIKVNLAKEQKAEGEGLGSKTAIWEQEGYLAKHAVSDEDRMAARGDEDGQDGPADPMQGLEGLDVAGPQQA